MQPQIGKLFMNGGSQAVRLPKEFRFKGDEVLIHREGDRIVLTPRTHGWREFFEDVPLPTEDFLAERIKEPPQDREDIF